MPVFQQELQSAHRLSEGLKFQQINITTMKDMAYNVPFFRYFVASARDWMASLSLVSIFYNESV